MMQTPARNFDRVVKNVRNLVAAANAEDATGRSSICSSSSGAKIPDDPADVRLARELDVDAIIFNGLSVLRPDQEMNDSSSRR